MTVADVRWTVVRGVLDESRGLGFALNGSRGIVWCGGGELRSQVSVSLVGWRRGHRRDPTSVGGDLRRGGLIIEQFGGQPLHEGGQLGVLLG